MLAENQHSKLLKTAKALSLFTVVYNVLEGLVAVFFGLEESSVALTGFGFDSFVEVFSALLVYWKISGRTEMLEREQKALRGMGILFLMLAGVTVFGSIFQLVNGRFPTNTLAGVIVSLVSLSFMFFLWNSKIRVGKALNDKVILADASCSLACIKLSFILFAGSALYWFIPALWWIDSVAALGLSYFIAKEGFGFFSNESTDCCGGEES